MVWTKGRRAVERQAGVIWFIPNRSELEIVEWTVDHLGVDVSIYRDRLNYQLQASIRYFLDDMVAWANHQDPADMVDDIAAAAIWKCLWEADDFEAVLDEWTEDPSDLRDALRDALRTLGLEVTRVSIQGLKARSSLVWLQGAVRGAARLPVESEGI